jgi:hypothetical protein
MYSTNTFNFEEVMRLLRHYNAMALWDFTICYLPVMIKKKNPIPFILVPPFTFSPKLQKQTILVKRGTRLHPALRVLLHLPSFFP